MKFIIFLSFITFCLNITYTSSRRKSKNKNASGPEPKTVDTQVKTRQTLRYWFRCIPVKIFDCHSGKTEGSSLEENSKETLIEFLTKQNIKPIINTVLTSFKLSMVETEKSSLLFM